MFYGGIRLIFRVFEVCTTEYLKKQPLKCLTALLKVAWQTTERMLLLFYRPGKGEDFIQLPPSFLNYLSANRDGLPTPIL